MKAKVKSTGEIIEVKEWSGASDIVYSTLDMNRYYQESDLDFCISTPEKAVIDGWIARDRLNNGLFLHDEEPYRAFSGYQIDGKEDEWKSETCPPYPIDNKLFPSITWESAPQRVKIELTLIDNKGENNGM